VLIARPDHRIQPELAAALGDVRDVLHDLGITDDALTTERSERYTEAVIRART
jgi:hypothetical protein